MRSKIFGIQKLRVFTSLPILPGLVRNLEIPGLKFPDFRQVALRPRLTSEIAVVSEISDPQQISDQTWKFKVVPKFRAKIISGVSDGDLVDSEISREVGNFKNLRESVVAKAEELAQLSEAFGPKWRVVKDKYKEGLKDASLVFDLVPSLLEVDDPLLEKLLTSSPAERGQLVIDILSKEISRSQLRKTAETSVMNSQRKLLVREVIRKLQAELGELNGPDEFDDGTVGLPSYVKTLIDAEKKRIISGENPQEAAVTRMYINALMSVPWVKPAAELPKISEISDRLDDTHAAFTQAKTRILEIAACDFRSVRPLLLVGPPGTGKTSFASAVASAIGRGESEIFSLGGLSDAAELRGHRRTYVGARPGKLAAALMRRGRSDLVVVLDEIDKVGNSSGNFATSAGVTSNDVVGVLLEMLDDRKSFVDNFLDCELSTENIFFVATANDLGAIPKALLSRLEVVTVPGYVEEEKLAIASEHLLPKAVRSCGLEDAEIAFVRKVLPEIIRGYTRELGVRQLNTEIVKLLQKLKLKKLTGVFPDEAMFRLSDFLGPSKKSAVREDQARQLAGRPDDRIGETLALGWTEDGGEVLAVECKSTPADKLEVSVSGNVGSIMNEAVVVAVKAAIGTFPKMLFHVHLPDFGIRKDGSSVGLAAAISAYSSLYSRPVPGRVGLTGEVTLTGRVVGVQGVREKIVAAKAQGVMHVFLPVDNKPDWDELPSVLRNGMHPVFIDHIDTAIDDIFKRL